MVQIAIDDSLAKAIAEAGRFVTLIDSHGKTVAQVTPVDSQPPVALGTTPEELAEIERRMKEDDGARFTWAQVKEHLRSLASE